MISAVALPIPLAAAVITATWSLKRIPSSSQPRAAAPSFASSAVMGKSGD
jgi:hypothetical protein